jgi:leucyl aminopeptidase
MKISFLKTEESNFDSEILAIGAFDDQLTEIPLFQVLDKLVDGLLSQICQQTDFKNADDQQLVIHSLGRLKHARIAIIGLGRREEFQIANTREYGAKAALAAIKEKCHELVLALPNLDSLAQEKAAQFLIEGVLLGQYSFDRYKNKDTRIKNKIDTIKIILPQSGRVEPYQLAQNRAEIIAEATTFARDLVNEPASYLTPQKLSEYAQELATKKGLDIKILNPRECEKLKMFLFLAVARGSSEEPRFIHLIYRPKKRDKNPKRFVLVGKGITFDSGGLSLKPATSMTDMKTDMAGAAAVLGVISSLPAFGIKSEVHALIPATENMISGSAYKLGDIFNSLSGKSVEIVNTDAEGRLILADALAYGTKLAPDELIDIATLTGACVVALGPHMAGVMGNDRAMIERYIATARMVGEEVWPLPLPENLKEQLKSPVADLKNSGDRWGGALTAGLFLREFIGKTSWLHIDIAGPAFSNTEKGHLRKGGTGFGVASLIEYLISREETS